MLFEKIRIKSVDAVLHYTPNIAKWSAKNRKNHFIGIQLSGSARHRFDRQEFVLSRNCVYFFNQKDNYDVEIREPGEAFSVHFTTYEEIESDSFYIPIENPDEVLLLLQKIELLQNGGEKSELALLSSLYKLCDLICCARHKAYYSKDSRVDAAKKYIDENFKNSDCLHRAVEICGLSSRRFNDLFKERFKTTPNRYIVKKRIELAKHMLESNCLTVGEVAELCGFSDVYYFSKVFKGICGIPPSKWK